MESKKQKSHKKDKAVVGGRVKLIVLFRNWAHQGFTYLDCTERFYRIIWELVPAMFFYWLMTTFGASVWVSVIVALLLAHTLNWIVNDNFWTCIQFTLPNLLNPGNDKTKEYLAGMQDRMRRHESVGGCMIYGSLSRGVWQNKSDLDIRILRRKGIVYGLCAYIVVWEERLIALVKGQPLDIYMADSEEFLERMRSDEYPIFLKNSDTRLKMLYGEAIEADFSVIDSLNELARRFEARDE